MADLDDSGLLSQRGNRGKNGKPRTGSAMLRLYRNDPVWRGALDLAAIGTLIMLLVHGFPDLFSGLDRFFPGGATPAATSTTGAATPAPPGAGLQPPFAAANPAGAGAPAANFNSATAQNPALHQPAPLLPANHHYDPRILIRVGKVSPADKEILDRACDLIGVSNQQADDLLHEKADKGDPNYQYLMGVLMVTEGEQEKSEDLFAKSIYWLKEAAFQAHPGAQFELAQIYRLGTAGISRDLAESVKWYEMAAKNPNNTDGMAENELARLYESGVFFPKDVAKAEAYYEAAANKGNAESQSNVGAIYYNGTMGPRDLSKALFWTQKSAENGYVTAQMNLGQMYLWHGTNGVPDYAQFLKWTGLAADQGLVKALNALGDFYRTGAPGFPPDQTAAARYYRLAALKKDAKAQYYLGQIYEQGLGMPQDLLQSYVYYSLSYDGGFAPAYAALQSLKTKLSAGQLEYAGKMAQALKPDTNRIITTGFAGIGVELTTNAHGMFVVGAYPGTPAGKAGLQKGDELLTIDGLDATTMQLPEASTHLKGQPGTTVTLTYARAGLAGPQQVTLTRAMIQPSDMRGGAVP